MEYLSLILSATVINLFAAISPGPDFVVCARNSVMHTRQIGFYTGLGIAAGLMVHMLYCSVGIGLIIYNSPLLFSIIKYLGAIYLIYIGVMSIVSKSKEFELANNGIERISNFQALKMGFITNVFNPKATLFFLAMFTMIIKPTTPHWVVLIIFIIVIITAISWFSIVAVLFSHTHIRNKYLKNQTFINILFGILLIAVGLKVGFMK